MNMLLVSFILVFFYLIAFGISKLFYNIVVRKNKNNDSYWQSHIADDQQINYDSAY